MPPAARSAARRSTTGCAARGASFGEKLGWERPNWFAAAGETPEDIPTFERPNWFAAVAREHRACREAAALFDQTSFAKFMLTGRDAEAALSWIAANDVTRPPGALTYTQMLNPAAASSATSPSPASPRTPSTSSPAPALLTHDFHWIARNIPAGLDARLVDVTSQNAVLALMGPRARDILAAVAEEDVSNAAFPFASVRRLSVAGAPVLALRITYVGELGWELHVPIEFAATVYDALTRPAARTASSTPATAPSSRCGSKRATAPGAPTSAPTIRR